jgi:hypothetical protein
VNVSGLQLVVLQSSASVSGVHCTQVSVVSSHRGKPSMPTQSASSTQASHSFVLALQWAASASVHSALVLQSTHSNAPVLQTRMLSVQ